MIKLSVRTKWPRGLRAQKIRKNEHLLQHKHCTAWQASFFVCLFVCSGWLTIMQVIDWYQAGHLFSFCGWVFRDQRRETRHDEACVDWLVKCSGGHQRSGQGKGEKNLWWLLVTVDSHLSQSSRWQLTSKTNFLCRLSWRRTRLVLFSLVCLWTSIRPERDRETAEESAKLLALVTVTLYSKLSGYRPDSTHIFLPFRVVHVTSTSQC